MNLVVIVEPPAEPVTLAEVYVHLRLTPDDDSPPAHPDDAMLRGFITAARIGAEQQTKRAFVEQTVRLTTERFPASCRGHIELLRPPLMGVQSVKYYDEDNELQTVSVDDYFVTDDLVPRLMFSETFAFPGTYERADAVRVDYVTGYEPEGSPAEDYVANVPQPIKDAILLGVQLLYDPLTPEQRKAIEGARDSLLMSYIVHTF